MTDVVDINRFRPKKVETVWECSCGCQLFYLQEDGAVQCRSCQEIIGSIEWAPRAE